MRRLSRLAVVGLLVTLTAHSAFGDDFDPRGRKRPGAQPKPSHGASQAPVKPGRASEPQASVPRLVERYTSVVLAQPGSPFPLQRLAQLYRDRDGNVGALLRDFESRAEKPGDEQYAATVGLAGLYKLEGRADDALKAYERAILLRPTMPVAHLALARLLQDRGELQGARTSYEAALKAQTAPSDREATLRVLMQLALDAKDWTAAKASHDELVRLQPTSLYVRGELGRELVQRGEYERAEAELVVLVTAAAGDNRALAPALKDLGKAQAKAHKRAEAILTLKRALAAAGREAAVRSEIYDLIAEAYRADQQLGILIKQLEDEHPTDFERLSLLGALYEETGDGAKALLVYAKALAIHPRHIDLRVKVIRILQAQGELEKAISEYESLIRSAPNNPQFVFEQCDALLQRGDRARALRLLQELERRGQRDEDALSRLAEVYARVGDSDRSLAVLMRLANLGTGDPGHLVDLGDRYFQSGQQALAVQNWRRILSVVTPRARALVSLGEVFLEHDMLQDALAALREAVQLDPSAVSSKKVLAMALERNKSFQDARQIWQELAEKAKAQNDKVLSREARTRIVALWGYERLLDAQVPLLSAKLNARPPDLDAGRLLAEVLLRQRKLAAAEATLKTIVAQAPGDTESYLALERVLVQEGKLAEAVTTLERLVAADPKNARQLYQRMAQYAGQLYRDEDAIAYARRAVELNPDDAEGHRRLGEMYRQKQDFERAVVELRAAITKNDRLYVVFVELADLLVARGEIDEADRLYRRVIRGAPDEELVVTAARQSKQINLGKGTLASLEEELLPLAIGNPQRNVYRKLLVDVYGSLTFGLVERAKHGEASEALDARKALARIGARAVKPLLDALADGDAGQQRIAIDVLGHVENKNAASALFSFATGPYDTQLRARAMLACGALREPSLLPRYEALIFFPRAERPSPNAPRATVASSDAVARAASWAVARLGDKRAAPLLRRLVEAGSPDMRAFALLGLAALGDRTSLPVVVRAAQSVESGPLAHAAAAMALGVLGSDADIPTLLTMAEGSELLPKPTAFLALAGLLRGRAALTDAPPMSSAVMAMASALFTRNEAHGRGERLAQWTREAAAASLVLLGQTQGGNPLQDGVPRPGEDVDAESTLVQLLPRALPTEARGAALVQHREAIQKAAATALLTSGDGARSVLEALRSGALDPLLVATEDGPELQAARTAMAEIRTSLEPGVVPIVKHPDVSVRANAIALLGRSTSELAVKALAEALLDPSEDVLRTTLASIGAQHDPRIESVVMHHLKTHERWAVRVLAAEALGRLGEGPSKSEIGSALRDVARQDPYALVREAALRALVAVDAARARELARPMAVTDPEPRVRETATEILSASPHEER